MHKNVQNFLTACSQEQNLYNPGAIMFKLDRALSCKKIVIFVIIIIFKAAKHAFQHVAVHICFLKLIFAEQRVLVQPFKNELHSYIAESGMLSYQFGKEFIDQSFQPGNALQAMVVICIG